MAQQAVTADLTHEQRALLAVLRFRADVARGETVVDRCTAILHGGAPMAGLVGTVAGARLVGSDPGARSCGSRPAADTSRAVLGVDTLWRETRRDSVLRYDDVTVVVLTTTWRVGQATHERFVAGPAARNLMSQPWVVREYELYAGSVWHRAPPVPGTTEFHTAVLRAISPGPPGFLRVDPRPLAADPTLEQPTAEALATVQPAAVDSMRALLGRLGIPEADALAPDRCPGVLVPNATATLGVVDGCPATPSLTAILGLPHRGGAYFPGRIDERASATNGGRWTVRVIQRFLGPGGSATSVFDYVMEYVDDAWRLQGKVLLLSID